MKRIAVCDAETDPFRRGRVPKPFVWGFYDGSVYEEFRSTEEFVYYLMFFDGICYAHNGGKFDWHFLLPYANAYDSVMLINGRVSRMMLGDCECRDSMNIIPVSLAQMEKEKIDYRIMEKGERDKPKNRIEISKYLKSDCVNLHKFVMRFIEDFGLHLTLAGAAMKQWRKISDRPVPRTDEEFYNQISPFYYGGRVECFETGIINDNFSVYDINSAYPKAMIELHPYSDNFDRVDRFSANADFYRLRCVSHGALPFRTKDGLTFPNDDMEREYTISKWEYQAGLDTGTIDNVEILESLLFMGHQDFTSYIEHFYEAKRKSGEIGDVAGYVFAKLFMNALYGKFSANPDNYDEYMIIPEEVVCALKETGWCYAGMFGPWALASAKLPDERRRYFNVATGASITGYVRAMLWRAICDCKGVIYCDTDSIITRTKGDSVVLGDALGEWKHEGNFDRAGIAGKKLYIMRGAHGWYEDASGKTVYKREKEANSAEVGLRRLYKSASKGVRLSHAELWAVAKGETVSYTQQAPTFSPKREPRFITREVRFTC